MYFTIDSFLDDNRLHFFPRVLAHGINTYKNAPLYLAQQNTDKYKNEKCRYLEIRKFTFSRENKCWFYGEKMEKYKIRKSTGAVQKISRALDSVLTYQRFSQSSYGTFSHIMSQKLVLDHVRETRRAKVRSFFEPHRNGSNQE